MTQMTQNNFETSIKSGKGKRQTPLSACGSKTHKEDPANRTMGEEVAAGVIEGGYINPADDIWPKLGLVSK